jgi:DHA1 family inner membrane transport protein
MTSPTVTDRLRLRVTRPQLRVPLSIVVATVVSTVVFSATPFLVPAVSSDFDVTIGLAGALSTSQLGGFMVATWFAGRFLRPRRRFLTTAALTGAAANVSAAVTPWFAVLVADRFVSGVSLGLIAWISWSEVFGDDERVGDIAVVGPVVGTIASPLIAVTIDRSGATALFLALAVINLVPLLFVRATRFRDRSVERPPRHRPANSAIVILACLGALTFGGSAVFVYAAAIGVEQGGLSPFAVSIAFSLNALAGIPTARYRGPRNLAGVWMAITGVSAVVLGAVHAPVAFYVAMVAWGAAFWMGIPATFSLLVARSYYPQERAGDAQSVMALGRVFGPLVGGAVYSNTSSTALGVVGGGVMLAASVMLLYAEWRIRPLSFAAPIDALRRWSTDPTKDAR